MNTEEKLLRIIGDNEQVFADYERIIGELKDENDFLTETITTNKLGKITTERRDIQSQMFQMEIKCEKSIKDANAVKKEYYDKLDELNTRLSDVKKKQNETDIYINAEAEKKVKKIKDEYKKKLSRHKAENDKILQQQLTQYKNQHKIIVYVMIGCILFGIIGIVINFL